MQNWKCCQRKANSTKRKKTKRNERRAWVFGGKSKKERELKISDNYNAILFFLFFLLFSPSLSCSLFYNLFPFLEFALSGISFWLNEEKTKTTKIKIRRKNTHDKNKPAEGRNMYSAKAQFENEDKKTDNNLTKLTKRNENKTTIITTKISVE